MPRKRDLLPPELTDAALAVLIPEVRGRGSRESACLGGADGSHPKVRYTSAACARRGAVAYSWAKGDDLGPLVVVYRCEWCGFYHSGRSRTIPVPITRRPLDDAA